MKIKFYLLLIVLFVLFPHIKAQESNSDCKFDVDKLVYGADIGFGISSINWTVGVSPQVGYKLSEKFHVGAGVTYLHAQSKSNSAYNYNENSLGLNLFAHYYPYKKLVFRLKPEVMHTWYKADVYTTSNLGNDSERFTANKFAPAIVTGVGFHFKPVMLLLNYELLQNEYSSYSDTAFLSIGFMF